VVRWLQAGHGVAEVGERAARLVGEPVDVADFLDVLTAEGVLDPTAAAPDAVSTAWRRVGRVVFSRAGWIVQGLLAVAGLLGVLLRPELAPRPSDMLVAASPLLSVLVMSAAAVVCTLLHEAGHVLAAAARGVPSRLSVTRRLYFLTAQADLTALWGLPRAQRLPPLLAGLSVDAAVTGGLLLARFAGAPAHVDHVLAATVVLQVAAMVFQAAVFLRTDLYAVLATLSGSRNLWGLKSALLRAAVARTRPADRDLLRAASPRERRWALAYLGLYLPGLAAAVWYLAAVSLPGLWHLVGATAGGFAPFDLRRGATWESLATVGFVAVPTALPMLAWAGSGVRRLAGSLTGPRDEAAGAGEAASAAS
jgi:hypothetical protein